MKEKINEVDGHHFAQYRDCADCLNVPPAVKYGSWITFCKEKYFCEETNQKKRIDNKCQSSCKIQIPLFTREPLSQEISNEHQEEQSSSDDNIVI